MPGPATTLGALAAISALVLAGCAQSTQRSTGNLQGTQKQVAQAIDDVATAAKRGDARKICDSYLSADVKAQLTRLARTSRRGTDCADQLKDSIRDADSFDVLVESVDVSGRRATARVQTRTPAARDPVDTITLVDERGWRIASLPK